MSEEAGGMSSSWDEVSKIPSSWARVRAVPSSILRGEGMISDLGSCDREKRVELTRIADQTAGWVQ